uniref:Cytochrome P450 n=1 Tax=Globisporangium ultimum (strain ATCC 200006 / CBS 805.95 / DAOM BR144) TaxID=431595 RepID=K3X3M2_GLOUD
MTALVCVALVGLLSYPLRALQRKQRIANGLKPLDGPKGVILLGILPKYIANKTRIYDFLEDLLKQFHGRMKLPWHLFFDGAIYVSHPEDVKHILSTNFDNYIKPPGFIAAFDELFAGSLFAMNHAHCADGGAKWKLQRKVAAKVFTTTNFKLFVEQIFDKYAREMATKIDQSEDGKCDMQDIARQYTLYSIFDITLGVPLTEVADVHAFGESIDFANEQSAARMFIKQHYRWLGWCMPSEYRLQREVAAIRKVTVKILAQRVVEPEHELAKRFDSLSMFVKKMRELENDEASLLDLDTLQRILHTFIFAGRDTTSSFITHTIYALCRHPEVQRKVADEISELTNNDSSDNHGGSVLSYDGIKNLRYLDAVVHEALRMYPPVPFNIKRAAEDDHLPDGTFVPAGCDLAYSPWYMGRNSAMWMPDPLVFRPERWLEMATRPTAFEFPVFQAGPRICIGMNMAVLQAKMFVATMVQRFDGMKIQDGQQQERGYVLRSTLTMDGGLPLQMVSRAKPSTIT